MRSLVAALVGTLAFASAFAPPPGCTYNTASIRSFSAVAPRMAEKSGFSLPLFGNFGGAKNREAQLEEAKQRVRKLVARTKQGKEASDAEREDIFKALEALERLNPTTSPASSDLLGGKWSLLYTGASVEDAAQRRVKEGVIGSAVTELTGASEAATRPRGLGQVLGEGDEAELPLGRRLTTLAGNVIENKGNFQDIDVANGLVENRAEFALWGLPATVRIQGRCERVPDKEARLAVFFERVELKLSAVSATLPLTWANGGKGPEGWVETTFLDADLRTGRGDKGSFFIAARRS